MENAFQNITVTLTDDHGHPLSIPYCVMSGKDTVCRQQTTLSGLQRIPLYAQKGKSYTLHTRVEGREYSFALPPCEEGATLQVASSPLRTTYHVLLSPGKNLTDYRLYAFHPDWGVNEISLSNPGGIVSTKELPPGILSFFLLDGGCRIVSQRSVWTGKEKESADVPGLPRQYAPGEEINWRDVGGLSTDTALFCRIVKDDYWCAPNAESGKTYQTEADSEGNFRIAVDDFKEGDSFFLQAYTGKKKDKTDFFQYKMKDDIFPAVARHLHVRKEQTLGEAEVEIGHADESAYGLDKNNLLPEVKVKARLKQDKHMPTKRFYKTNYIDAKYIVERNYTEMEAVIRCISTIALRKLPPPDNTIITTGGINEPYQQYKLTCTRRSGVLAKEAEVKVLLDNMQVNIDEVMYMHPFDIESMEYLTPREALAVTHGVIAEALVIKTRKTDSHRQDDVKAKGIIYMPMGIANNGLDRPASLKAPKEKGLYKILIDKVYGGRNVTSFEVPVRVE